MKQVIYFIVAASVCMLMNACADSVDLDKIDAQIARAGEDYEAVEIVLEESGTLSEKLGEKASSVEKLVLSGPLDAADVKTLNALPLLHSLDMKKAQITDGGNADDKLKKNTITEYMFYELRERLYELSLPQSLIAIERRAFTGMKALKRIELAEGICVIGEEAFSDCEKLVDINLPQTLVTLDFLSFRGCKSLERIVIPDKIEEIADQTFWRCSSLKEVVLPKNLKNIENAAFMYCEALERIEFPDGLEQIGAGAFAWTGLKTLVFPESLADISIKLGETGAFHGCQSLETISLPPSFKGLAKNLFKECSALVSMKIPDGVQDIPSGCFANCTSLKHIEIPEGVLSIGDYAFYGVAASEIKLPASLQSIGACALQYCPNLKSITIPQNLTSFGDGFLADCYELSAIFWETSAPFGNVFLYHPYGGDVLSGNPNCLLYLSDPNTPIKDKNWKNIIINGLADEIVLESGKGTFSCPVAFKALKVTYTKEFNKPTYSGESAGWESLSLPFAVDKITHESGQILAPFNSSVENAKPFWLRRLTMNGFENVTSIEAGIPYIIAMPNNKSYKEEYNIKGKVTFSAENPSGILIAETGDAVTEEGPSFVFCSNYRYVPMSTSVYVLNKEADDIKAGSMFVRSQYDALSFEAYVVNKGAAAKAYRVDNGSKTRGARMLSDTPCVDDM